MRRLQHRIAEFFVVSALIAGPAVARGGVIYRDDFSGSADRLLDETAPDRAPQAESWHAPTVADTPQWMADGSIRASDVSQHRNAFLPFVPEPGEIYKLSADMRCTGGEWLAVGFTRDNAFNEGFATGAIGASPWMNDTPEKQGYTFVGPGNTDAAVFSQSSAVSTLEIVLDTRKKRWEADWICNGIRVRTHRFETNPAIRHIGFGRWGFGEGRIERLELTSGAQRARTATAGATASARKTEEETGRGMAPLEWVRDDLFIAPEYRVLPDIDQKVSGTIRPILYDNTDYDGQVRNVFAWLGVPADTDRPAAGIVLVHGENGTAYREWVKRWNGRGYAALALDLNGMRPRVTEAGKMDMRRMENGASGAWNDFDGAKPLKTQWMYQAVTAVIRARGLLGSLPQVDNDSVGVMGFSWGSVVAADAVGARKTFAFGILMYGCGFLGEAPYFRQNYFSGMDENAVQAWLAHWDPSHYMERTRGGILFCSNMTDEMFPYLSWRKTYFAMKGRKFLALRVKTPHGRGFPTANAQPEVPVFVKEQLGTGVRLPKINKHGVNRHGYAWVLYDSDIPLKRAVLNYTTDKGPFHERTWRKKEAVVKRKYVTTPVPDGATAGYYDLIDERGAMMSWHLMRF